MRVLVTIGSMVEKKFTRLFKIIDELCEEGVLNGREVIAQVGYDKYIPKNFDSFDMTSAEEFKQLIIDSDLIITHAGTGTVTSSLKHKKKTIIFPRLIEFDEHYDNHQLEICDLFTKDGHALCAKNKKELKQMILGIDLFKPKEFKSNNNLINNIIIDFIEKVK